MKSNAHPVLRFGLLGNAFFSTACAAVLLITAATLAPKMGLTDPAYLKSVGLSLIPFAIFLVIAANRASVRLKEVYLLSAMDAMWVVGSAILLLSGIAPFTSLGIALVIGVAIMVGLLMCLQLWGARQHQRLLNP